MDACNEERSDIPKVMETRQVLKDTEGYDWLESTELAIDKRKFLLNRLFVNKLFPKTKPELCLFIYCCKTLMVLLSINVFFNRNKGVVWL